MRQPPIPSNGGPFQYAAAVSFGTNACWQGQSGSAALGGAEWTLAAATSVAAIEMIGKTCLADTRYSAARRAIRPFAGS